MPNDYGHEYADKELKSLEKRITKEYKEAAKEVEKKMNDYLAKFADKDAQMKKRLGAGEITASEYAEWRMRQMFTGDRWKAMSETLSADLVNADKIAAGMINETLPSSYAENFNYGTYEIEHGAEMNTNFVLYDKDTVINLMKDDPKIIPKANVDIPKDMVWNKRKIISAVTQGILQGEAIPKIARRLQSVTDMDRRAAIRNARTYTTAAENKGRIDSYDRAKDMGINVKKEWLATLDERTRMEHRHLDGMAVDNDEPFEVDGYTIMYPGDPSAEPEMIYNCRCTIVARIADYKYNDERNDSKLGDMTYEEWKHAKDKPQKEEENKPTSNIIFADNVKDYTKDLILKLEEQYNTRLGEVSLGANKGAGDVDIAGYTMRLSSEKPDTILHEFAHTLANSSADKYGLTNDTEFWKEIDKVKKEYRKDVQQDTNRWISSYEHSRNDKDEFFAEAFTMSKMNEMGLELPDKYGNDFTYSDKVLEIVDKYFGKEVLSEETSDEKGKPNSATEYYVSGEGMWINQYLRGRGDFGDLTESEEQFLKDLDIATDGNVKIDTLYRSVDASAIFGNMSQSTYDDLRQYVVYGEDSFGKGKYADSVKEKAENLMNKTEGKEIPEKGFMSTTKDKDIAMEFGDFTGSEMPIVMKIDTGGNAHGVDVSIYDKNVDESEKQEEVLLARNQRYIVERIYAENHTVCVDVKLVNDDSKKKKGW